MSAVVEEVERVEIRPEQLEELQAKVESQKKKLKKQKKKLEFFENQKNEIQDLKEELAYTHMHNKALQEEVKKGEALVEELRESKKSLFDELDVARNTISFLDKHLQKMVESEIGKDKIDEEIKEINNGEKQQNEEIISYDREEFLAIRNSEETEDNFEKLYDEQMRAFKIHRIKILEKIVEARDSKIAEYDDLHTKLCLAKEVVKKLILEKQEEKKLIDASTENKENTSPTDENTSPSTEDKENTSSSAENKETLGPSDKVKENTCPAKDPLFAFACIYVVMAIIYLILF